MNQASQILNSIKTALDGYLSDRVVTRSYREFNRYQLATLQKGVITILHDTSERDADDLDRLDVLLLCQIVLPEKATTEAVEDAELEMASELRAFADSVAEPHIQLGRCRTSKQMEHPYGWAMMNASIPNVDVYGMPDEDLENLPDFVTFHAGYEPAGNDEDVTTEDTVTLETD